MAPRRDRLYAGAAGRIARRDLAAAPANVVVQPKLDGIYGLVSFDRAGRLSSIVTRAGEVLGPALLAEFRGVRWCPSSTIVAEVELWTEASARAAAARGYRMLHVLDAHRIDGRDLTRERYRARRDALMRAESALINADEDKPWTEDAQGDAHDARGRYQRAVPLGWRRVRVVPQLPATRAELAWSEWVERGAAGPCEGLVAVDLEASLGKGKRKCKEATTLDVVVVQVDARALVCWWAAAQRRITVARPRSLDVAVGAMIELAHEGFHDSGEPRFCRVMRARRDLAAA